MLFCHIKYLDATGQILPTATNTLLSTECKDRRTIDIVHFSTEKIGKMKSGDISTAESGNKGLDNLIADKKSSKRDLRLTHKSV